MTERNDLTVTNTTNFSDTNITNVTSITLDTIANDASDKRHNRFINRCNHRRWLNADIILKDDKQSLIDLQITQLTLKLKFLHKIKTLSLYDDDNKSAINN